MAALFDTHAHISDKRFDEDRKELLRTLPDKDIALVLECGTEFKDWAQVKSISESDYVYSAFGVHPHSAAQCPENYLDALERYLDEKKCVALGEIGLDYHYDFSPRDVQRKVLSEQLELAIAKNKPVILHVRESYGDMMNILKPLSGKLRGVLHCYSGSAEMAKDFLGMGLYLGFGGAITFKSARHSHEVIKMAALDRLLIETDCPYMTPVPYRSQRNDPSFVHLVCEKMAEIREMTYDQIADLTLNNGKRLFEIS